MGNSIVLLEKTFSYGLMKLAGLHQITLQLQPGTKISLWSPAQPTKKPAVVFLHGFAANGNFTWMFQVNSLSKNYSVYVPDLLFFGGSFTDKSDRSPNIQADCIVQSLRQFGVENCVVVAFSYGGIVAFKMAEKYPEFVKAMVISGFILNLTEPISEVTLHKLGVSSSRDLLLPTTVEGVKDLLATVIHRKIWLPYFIYHDFLQVMFGNRKEKKELLEASVVCNKENVFPELPQKILLLWGAEDKVFRTEVAYKMKVKLGERATMETIKEGGHLVHIERPIVFNTKLEEFLASLRREGYDEA